MLRFLPASDEMFTNLTKVYTADKKKLLVESDLVILDEGHRWYLVN
jgi:hypothetical protein